MFISMWGMRKIGRADLVFLDNVEWVAEEGFD